MGESEKSPKKGDEETLNKKKDEDEKTATCNTCLGILIVKSDGKNPSCYGMQGQKDVRLADLQNDVAKLHFTSQDRMEKPDSHRNVSIYCGNVLWALLRTKKKNGIIVHPMQSVVLKALQKAPSSPDNNSNNNNDAKAKESQTSLPFYSNYDFISCENAVLNRMKNNASSVANNFKYIMTNLSTNFVPRFMDASSKVALAGVKVTNEVVKIVKDTFSK